jgi:hypothetical protein
VDSEALIRAEAGVPSGDWDTIENFEWQGVSIGRGAIGAARWKLRTHFLDRHPLGRETTLDFIRSGIRWTHGMNRVLDLYAPDVVVMLNGVFLPERVTAELAAARGARLVFFERGRDAGSVFLSHEDPAPRYDISKSWAQAAPHPLSVDEENAVSALLDRRARGEKVVEKYWPSGAADGSYLKKTLHIPDLDRVAVLYTNVIWDTAMQDRDIIFRDMFAWLEHCVELFRTRPDWTLVIRVHPAETQLSGRESYDRVAKVVEQRFPSLPPNVRVVPPDQPVDSYALMRLARIGLVYASTAGLELVLHGVPLVVAGDAHYRGKGFTHDPTSVEEFSRTVLGLMDMGSHENEEFDKLARKYAHLFFLRRTLPASVVDEPEYGKPRLAYSTLEELQVGSNPTLDVICDGILTGSEFAV